MSLEESQSRGRGGHAPAGAPAATGAGQTQETGLRAITDARTLRALAHPVRIALLETLTLAGPLTATQAGDRIGESATTCSFHLRQLAKYGFVEEAGGGPGRTRPWRLTSIGLSITGTGDQETELAAEALLSLVRERHLARLRQWLDTKADYPQRWRQAAENSEYLFYLTAEELEQLSADVAAVLMPKFRERLANPSARPPDALPVELLLYAYPIAPPADPAGGGPAGALP